MAIVPLHNCLSVILFYVVFCFGSTAEGHIVYTVSEETNPGTTVGNLAKDLNLNLQDITNRGFQLVSGANKSLKFPVQTGDIRRPSEQECKVLSVWRSPL
nr:cadherin-related neuronal receptor variable 9 short splicing form 1 [Danio rerio]